jgi:hypothetical protein
MPTTMSGMDDLLRLAPPPATLRHPPDWSLMPEPVPDDLRAVVDRYGCGRFDDFLTLWSPGHPNRYADLVFQTAQQRDVLRQRPSDVAAGWDPDRLQPWGMSDNGDACFLELDSGEVVLLEARGPDTHRHAGGVSSFLAAFLAGGRVAVFPDGIEPSDPRFSPH